MLRAAAESSDPKVKPFEDLANLSLARTFYSTGQFDLAVKYFDRVSQESYDWANSLFEASWANFMLKQKGYSKALGNIHTLQAPFFENYIKPESVAEALTVKATIYFYNCLYDRAAEAIDEFNAVYPQLFQDLKKLVTSTPDNTALFEVAAKIRNGTSGMPEQTERAARGVLGDLSLVKRFQYVEELDSRAQAARQGRRRLEVDQHRPDGVRRPDAAAVAGGQRGGRPGAPPHQPPHRRAGPAHQARHQDRVRNPAGREGRPRAGESSRSSRSIARRGKRRGRREIRVDDEHNMWPFTGEYWRDELGYYRVKVANKCEKSAPEGRAVDPGEGPAGERPPRSGGRRAAHRPN